MAEGGGMYFRGRVSGMRYAPVEERCFEGR